ncbi:MAG: trypsin-like peptidase domain-containing protein [Deltaproteobacteria bacterium]|nr:trypsin-like peptidase domain-containing protein [Deltaproteobacteria bacterium]
MFADACKLAARYTYPVVIARRYFDRTTECGCAAFVVLNEQGWIATAAHLLAADDALQRSCREISAYYGKILGIQAEPDLTIEEKRKKISRLKTDPKWVTNVSFRWGNDGMRLREVRLLPEADLAIGRLEPFDPDRFRPFPVVKDPASLDVGTPLCKLGYPFQQVKASYDESDGGFRLSTGPQPLSGFPMEGIYTRTLTAGKSSDGRYNIKFLETSSPGLIGQSGGPLFDSRGTLWGVQSRTDMHSFPIRTRIPGRERTNKEILSLNLGVAIHPELLVSYLMDQEIPFRLSDY